MRYNRPIHFLSLFFSIIFLNGCGGSGNGTPPSGGAPSTTGTATYLFYTPGLHAVDPANAASPVLVDASAVQTRQIFFATYDGATKTSSGFHVRSVVYVSGGKVWKISALASSGPPGSPGNPPVQLSNEVAVNTTPGNAASLCNAWVAEDYRDHTNSRYAYKLAGADNNCNSNDDVVKVVSLGMDSTAPPLTLAPGLEPMVSIIDQSSGALASVLALDRVSGNLTRRNLDFTAPLLVKSGITTQVSELQLTADNRTFLNIDGDLYLYNFTTGSLSASLFSSGLVSAELLADTDGSALYFWVKTTGNTIYKFPFSGSSAADRVTLAAEAAGTVVWGYIAITTNRVAYVTSTASNGTYALKSVPRSGGAPETLVVPTTVYTNMLGAAGSRVYFSQGHIPPTLTPTARIINEDGTSPVTLVNASWAGASVPTAATIGAGTALTKVILAGFNATVGDYGGEPLTSFDAATYSGPIILGTIPAGVTSSFLSGWGNNHLGTIQTPNGSGGTQSDIIYANINTAGALARVTDTTGTNEWPWF